MRGIATRGLVAGLFLLGAGCGDLREAARERAGCEASCKVALECAFGSPGAVPGCTDACVDQLDAKGSACREATARLGECADGLTCDDFSDGACRAEFDEATAACNETDGGAGDGGPGDGGAGSDGGDGGADPCERFGFVASGESCASTGCSGVSCECEGDFPRSITSCTDDGCIVEMDCAEVCAADSLGDALDCTHVYTVRPGADAGTDAGAGDGGTDGGTGGGDGGTDAGPADAGGDAGTDAGPSCTPTTCVAEGPSAGPSTTAAAPA